MEVLRIERNMRWPEILRLMPERTKENPQVIDIEFEGAVRQAISRTLKRKNPEMKFGTEIVHVPELGREVLNVWKKILPIKEN
jgi:hypothetical protein